MGGFLRWLPIVMSRGWHWVQNGVAPMPSILGIDIKGHAGIGGMGAGGAILWRNQADYAIRD